MYEELYQENKGLLQHVARKYAGACQYDRAVTVEDLIQAGFLGLVRAAETFKQAEGKSWASWAAWAITSEIHRALGLKDGKPTKAHTGAQSLDAPLSSDDPDGATGLDMLEDGSLPDPVEELSRENMQHYVRRAIERLQDDQQRAVIQICAIEQQPYEAAAKTLCVSVECVRKIRNRALGRLRSDRKLRSDARAFLEELELQTPYYHHVGVESFASTNISATERAAFYQFDHIQRRAESLERMKKIEQDLNDVEMSYQKKEQEKRAKPGRTGQGASVC